MPNICDNCNKEWNPSLSDRHKKCPSCRHSESRKNKTCDICGKHHNSDVSICRDCRSILNIGSGNPNWKGGNTKHYNPKGYVYLHVKDHPRGDKNRGYVFEHIVVMENKLQRKLVEGENVHHINGIRDDNRIENLELWTRPQPSGIRVKDAILWAKEVLERYGIDEQIYSFDNMVNIE